MTLVNRVSAFFLAALAICLAGYSLLSYVLIRDHLYGQFDDRLHHALNVLVAAIEVEPDGVKWQPSDHTITLGDERDADEVRWAIVDERGRVVDRSRNLDSASRDDRALLDFAERAHAASSDEVVAHDAWRLLQMQLTAPQPKSTDERDADEFDSLRVTVAATPRDLHESLVQLGALVILLPAALWLVAAVVGRWYCQRALSPVREMATRARSVTEADFRLRLDVATRRDELAELALAFNGLLDRLQQAFEQQRRFTGDAAHQLRTPLTVLRGEIDVALRRPRAETEYRAVLETLSSQTEELQRIVETLLFLARAESDAPLPHTEQIALASWFREYMERWRDHPRGADLVSTIDPDAHVNVSGALFSQALDNLIGNAIKYSPKQTPIHVRGTIEGDRVVLAVEDEGMGIAEEDRELIFAPFYRAPRARQSGIEGIGLGLALVARVANALGGHVRCEPKATHGARFVIYLPRASSANSSALR